MNLVVLIGRLTRDPEIRYIQSTGNYVTKFSLAVDRVFKTKDGVTADFFNISVFGKQAESCANYLAKGRLVAVRGRIQNNNYEDKNGVKHYSEQILADQVQFLEWGDKKGSSPDFKNDAGGKGDAFQSEEEEIQGLDDAGYQALDDEDIPF